MKNILILGALIIVVLGLIVVLGKPKEMSAPNTDEVEDGMTQQTDSSDTGAIITTNTTTTVTTVTTEPGTKLKADTFTGTLTKVDTGCFADGECYIEVDGKKVTAVIGFSQAVVGNIIGVEGFGDLENYIGKDVEIYAQDNSDGTYTLYGSTGFYIKVLQQ
jgi:hypothetical protein